MKPEQDYGQSKAQMEHARDTIREIAASGTSGVYGDYFERYHALSRKIFSGEESTQAEQAQLTDIVHIFIDSFGVQAMSKVLGAYFNHEVRRERIQQEGITDALRRDSIRNN